MQDFFFTNMFFVLFFLHIPLLPSLSFPLLQVPSSQLLSFFSCLFQVFSVNENGVEIDSNFLSSSNMLDKTNTA